MSQRQETSERTEGRSGAPDTTPETTAPPGPAGPPGTPTAPGRPAAPRPAGPTDGLPAADGQGAPDTPGAPGPAETSPAPGAAPDTPRSAPQVTVTLGIHQEKYLSARAREEEMHAIVTVRVDGAGAALAPSLAEVLVVDCSSSMNEPPEKFRAAKNAAAAAIGRLPDGAPFAVVQGTDRADTAYPRGTFMPPADPTRRADAQGEVYRLHAAGGTAIGTWLDLARRLLADQPAPIRHVLLLTDGQNVHDDRMPLAEVLDACEGVFVCDAWGIGAGWDARELLGITGRLHGSVRAVREASTLADEYRALMARLVAKSVPELVIRVTPSPGSTVRYLKQMYPNQLELTGVPEGPDGRSTSFVTRAWGDEVRRYQLCLSADPTGRPLGEDMQLAAVEVTVAGDDPEIVLPLPQPCVVHWTDDPVPRERGVDSHVGHFLVYQRLGQLAARAADAHQRHDPQAVVRYLGEAVRLTHRLPDRRPIEQLTRLVEIEDAAAGRVRLRPGAQPVEFQHLITTSSHSAFGPDEPHWTSSREPSSDGFRDEDTDEHQGLVECRNCRQPRPLRARFCPWCGRPRGAW